MRAEPRVLIVQRLVAHYRVPLFRELHRRWGWVVACAAGMGSHHGLNVAHGESFQSFYPFTFPSEKSEYRARVPLKAMIADHAPDLIIAEFSLQMSSTWHLALLRLFRRGPKVLFWSHGRNVERDNRKLKTRLLEVVRIGLSRMVDGHICYSEAGQKYLARYLPADRVFVARNTLDIEELRSTMKTVTPSAGAHRPTILSVGRFKKDKNFELLVGAFKDFLQRCPNARLVIVGDGEEFENVKKRAGELMGESVFLPGAVYKEEELAGYFSSADIFVIPGAAGLSVNHALAYSVPVVVFDGDNPDGPRHHPEIDYVIDGTTGFVIRDFSHEALYEFLVAHLSNDRSPKDELSGRLRRYVDENLLLEHMVEDFGVIRDFAAGNRSKALEG